MPQIPDLGAKTRDCGARDSLSHSREGVVMGELGTMLANLSVIFGGVLGGGIGFFILVLAVGVIALPYVLLNRRSAPMGRDNIPRENTSKRY